METQTKQCKIVVVGEEGSGKSSLVYRFMLDTFIESLDPAIEDSYRKQIKIGSETWMLDILDTAGEGHSVARDQYLSTANGIVFVFSVASRHSFERIYPLYKRILSLRDQTSLPMVLVGNKSDVQEADRQVSANEAREVARLLGCSYIETSALSQTKIKDVFHSIVHVAKTFDHTLSARPTLTVLPKKGVWDRLLRLSPFHRIKEC